MCRWPERACADSGRRHKLSRADGFDVRTAFLATCSVRDLCHDPNKKQSAQVLAVDTLTFFEIEAKGLPRLLIKKKVPSF
jgi:hypothetical protein